MTTTDPTTARSPGPSFQELLDEFDAAILAFMKREYSLALGERTAEEVKTKLATAYPLEEELYAEIVETQRIVEVPPEESGVTRRQFFNRATIGLMAAGIGTFSAASFVASSSCLIASSVRPDHCIIDTAAMWRQTFNRGSASSSV